MCVHAAVEGDDAVFFAFHADDIAVQGGACLAVAPRGLVVAGGGAAFRGLDGAVRGGPC